jgi:hypothetical protein
MAKQRQTNAGKIKDLLPKEARKPYGVYNRYDEYLDLLMNAVSIVEKGSGKPLPFFKEAFVKEALFEAGAVGYDKLSDQFYYVYGEGIDDYGNPQTLNLVNARGNSFRRRAYYDDDADGAYIIYSMPAGSTSLGDIIKETTNFMTSCDIAMRQNVEACKTPYIVVCKNEDLRLSFEQAIQQKQQGKAVVLVSQDLGEGLKAVNIECEFLSDRFASIRDHERDTLLNKLGIMTSNDDKKERVQSAEVNATIGQATDYIYLIIDTFNKQAESYGLPFEMKFNGSMEELYTDLDDNDEKDEAIDVPDVNELEERNNVK